MSYPTIIGPSCYRNKLINSPYPNPESIDETYTVSYSGALTGTVDIIVRRLTTNSIMITLPAITGTATTSFLRLTLPSIFDDTTSIADSQAAVIENNAATEIGFCTLDIISGNPVLDFAPVGGTYTAAAGGIRGGSYIFRFDG